MLIDVGIVSNELLRLGIGGSMIVLLVVFVLRRARCLEANRGK